MTIIPIRSLMVIIGFGLGFAAATRAEPLPAPPAPPGPAAPLKLMRVAFTDLSTQDVDARTLTVFRESLLVEMRKLQRVSVLGADEVRAMLDFEAQKQLAGCGDGNSCLAELADALGADAVIVGSVVKLGGETVVTLKRVDQKSAMVAQQTSKRLKAADGEELLAIVGDAIATLFPDVQLRAGEVRGVSDELAVRLHPPPLPPWAFWSTIGAGGVMASSTVVSATWWAASQQSFRDVANQARTQATPGLTVKERADALIVAETTMWACASATVLTIVVAAATVPFVDWDDVARSTRDDRHLGTTDEKE